MPGTPKIFSLSRLLWQRSWGYLWDGLELFCTDCQGLLMGLQWITQWSSEPRVPPPPHPHTFLLPAPPSHPMLDFFFIYVYSIYTCLFACPLRGSFYGLTCGTRRMWMTAALCHEGFSAKDQIRSKLREG